MRPGIDDQAVRELVRKNVGRLARPTFPWPGLLVPGRFGTIFDGTELVSASASSPELGGTLTITPAPPPDSLLEGRIIGAFMSIANGTRKIVVTTTLPAPCVIRALSLHGSFGVDTAGSIRVLLAQDDDTTLTTAPSGTDLIEFTGDVVGAEDPGVHANLAVADLKVEPWRKVLTAGTRVKLKAHNLTGAVRNVAVYVDLDLLA
jgi:hypothetical protein